jgi:hypothetical protein
LPGITAYARPYAKSFAGDEFNLSFQPLNASRHRVKRTDNSDLSGEKLFIFAHKDV